MRGRNTFIGIGWDFKFSFPVNDRKSFFSGHVMIGSENIQFFSSIGVMPLKKKVTIHLAGGEEKKGTEKNSSVERWGVGVSTQLWKCFPVIFDRGYASITLGQIARRSGSTNLSQRNMGIMIESYGDKNFGRLAIEENLSLGISSGMIYSINLRAYIILVRFGGLSIQTGAGFNASDLEKGNLSVNIRLFFENQK